MRWYWWLIIGLLVVGIILLIGWLEFGWFSEEKKEEKKLKKKLEEAKKAATFPLKIGVTNEAVRNVQRYLNSESSKSECAGKARESQVCKGKSLYPVEDDGVFGTCTEKAIEYCYRTNIVTEAQYDNLISKL